MSPTHRQLKIAHWLFLIRIPSASNKMFVRFTILVLALNFAVCSAFGQDATLEETLAWIKGKLDSQVPIELIDTVRTIIDGRTVSKKAQKYVYKGFEFRYNGCEIEYHSQYDSYGIESSAFESHQELIQKVSLKDSKEALPLSENMGAVYTIWDQYLVKSWTPVGFVKNNQPEDYFRETESDAHYVNVLYIHSTMMPRVVKALNHAIKLCGGGAKKEKF